MTVSLRPALTLAVIFSAAVSGAALSAANAMPAVSATAGITPSTLVKVHDDGDRYWRRHHSYHRHSYRGHVVDAPFTHVESGRRTVVDAPFAHVYNGRHGQHIVAPFVDLWVPR
jgi:hypothetical protein